MRLFIAINFNADTRTHLVALCDKLRSHSECGRFTLPEKPDDFMEYHMYVCPTDSVELKRHLHFRDSLRLSPQATSEYGTLKITLAEKYGNDIDAYTNGKTEFIRKILGKPLNENI